MALHTLEDEGFYCVDNLPVGLLPAFIEQLSSRQMQIYDQVAVGVDARSGAADLKRFRDIISSMKNDKIDIEVVYFETAINELIKRFSDTRRRHPLTRKGIPLAEAIDIERNLLSPIALTADLCLDTTHTNVHQLRSLIKKRIISRPPQQLSILFNRSVSSTVCRQIQISCSMCAACPTRTGSRIYGRSPGRILKYRHILSSRMM